MSLKSSVKKFWFEFSVLLIILSSILFFSYKSEIVTFIGLISSLVLIIIKSINEKQKSESHKLVLYKIEDILKSIHTFQQSGDIMIKYIKQKIYNLERRYQKELKELGIDIEEINEDIIITINLGERKLIAIPENRIEVKWNEGHKFINNYEELEEELKDLKKR